MGLSLTQAMNLKMIGLGQNLSLILELFERLDVGRGYEDPGPALVGLAQILGVYLAQWIVRLMWEQPLKKTLKKTLR